MQSKVDERMIEDSEQQRRSSEEPSNDLVEETEPLREFDDVLNTDFSGNFNLSGELWNYA